MGSTVGTRLGIDFGGTKIALGIVDDAGRILESRRIPTQIGSAAPTGLVHLTEEVRALLAEHTTVRGIGIGICCQVDPRTRQLDGADDNIPGWQDLDIARRLEVSAALPVYLDNDANAAALGEGWCGAARGLSDFLTLTIGTGVGGGVVAGGKMLHGAWGGAAELGHMPLDPQGPDCYCGGHGCLEQLIAGPALTQRAAEIGVTDAPALFLAASHSAEALRVVTEAGAWLAQATLLLLHVFQPEAVLYGGGVIDSAWPFWQPLLAHMQQRSGIPSDQRARLAKAALGTRAGIVGAAALVPQR